MGALLGALDWFGRTTEGAIAQPSDAVVSVEIVASRTLETLQQKQVAEPAPSPEATAPVEGKSEPLDACVAKADPGPGREVVEPPLPVDVPKRR